VLEEKNKEPATHLDGSVWSNVQKGFGEEGRGDKPNSVSPKELPQEAPLGCHHFSTPTSGMTREVQGFGKKLPMRPNPGLAGKISPSGRARHPWPLFGLAPRGVCPAPAVADAGGGLLPHLFTLAAKLPARESLEAVCFL
jgi:hypothetical protein